MAKAKPRRSQGTPSRTPLSWTIDEAATLIAHAHKCSTLEHFENTVVETLKQRWPSKEYDYYVVKNKMYRLWQKGGKQRTKWQDIITKGPAASLELIHFEEEERSAFKATGAFKKATSQKKQTTPLRNKTIATRSASRSVSKGLRSPMQTVGIITSPREQHTYSGRSPQVKLESGFVASSQHKTKKKRSASIVCIPHPFIYVY